MTLDEMRETVGIVRRIGHITDDELALTWAQSNIKLLADVLMELIDHVDPNCIGEIESLADLPAPPDAG